MDGIKKRDIEGRIRRRKEKTDGRKRKMEGKTGKQKGE